MDIRKLESQQTNFQVTLTNLLAWEGGKGDNVVQVVEEILAAIRHRGDQALLEYTKKFDHLEVANASQLELPKPQLQAALAALPASQAKALQMAAHRIRLYAQHQRMESWSYTETDGTLLGQQITPLDRVGLYVPGGKAAYPSSVLMNAIPAKVAGVPELIMVVPTPQGTINPLVLAAAEIAEVDRVFTIGGAQAIGALAYGTATLPAVDKIVGPGNIFVATAKRLVFGIVGIDMIAGPSEIVVVCDGHTDPNWIAMDLFSQAEHDEDAQAILISPDQAFLARVEACMEAQLVKMERAEIIRASLESRGALIHTKDLEEAITIVNRIAPEHLELSVADPEAMASQIRNAGAIFLGRHTAESLGDYCAGPNHVLPTGGTARFASPLGVYDFQKRSSLIGCSATGAAQLGQIASTLAHGEGLTAHAQSAEYRMGNQKDTISESPEEAITKRIARCIPQRLRSLSSYIVPASAGLIKLDAMENPYSWPIEMQQAWLQRLQTVALNRYPNPNATSLKQTLRQAMAIPKAASLLLGNGSDELLQICILALSQPGSAVLALEPGFSMYRLISQWAGLPYIGVPLTPDFAIDLPATLAAITTHQPTLIFLAFPNNPTGNLFSRSAMETIIQAAPGLVLVDEAYAPFAESSFMQDLSSYPQLLVMRTLSKLGLAGLRLGLLAGSKHWLQELDKLRLPYNINVLSQASAEFALSHQNLFEQQSDQIRQDRTLLAQMLEALPGITTYPSRANFILFRTLPNQAVILFEKLRMAGVLIKNLHGTHPLLMDCLRVTVGRPEENEFFLKALRQALQEISSV